MRDAVAALRAGGRISRELLVGSHESLRDLYECSRPELDWVVERAITLPGVRGARLTGAGWGGCAIVVGDEDALREAGPVLAARVRGALRARAAPLAVDGVVGSARRAAT